MAKTTKSKKGNAVPLQDHPSSEGEQYEDRPQDHKGANHLRTAENMLSASRKRREAKRRAIENEHKNRIEKTRGKIESFYEDRKTKLTELQSVQWEQLSSLLKTRRSIERAILKNTTLIEQVTLNMARELDAMYSARHDEIVEMDTTGNIIERTSAHEDFDSTYRTHSDRIQV